MSRVAQYIQFRQLPRKPGKLTDTWEVRSIRTNEVVGRVAWYGGWRKYVFSPAQYSFFEPDGLTFIAAFCKERTSAHLHAPVKS